MFETQFVSSPFIFINEVYAAYFSFLMYLIALNPKLFSDHKSICEQRKHQHTYTLGYQTKGRHHITSATLALKAQPLISNCSFRAELLCVSVEEFMILDILTMSECIVFVHYWFWSKLILKITSQLLSHCYCLKQYYDLYFYLLKVA